MNIQALKKPTHRSRLCHYRPLYYKKSGLNLVQQDWMETTAKNCDFYVFTNLNKNTNRNSLFPKYFLNSSYYGGIGFSTVRPNDQWPEDAKSLAVLRGHLQPINFHYDFKHRVWMVGGKLDPNLVKLYDRNEWPLMVKKHEDNVWWRFRSHTPEMIERTLKYAGICTDGIYPVKRTNNPIPRCMTLEKMHKTPASYLFERIDQSDTCEYFSDAKHNHETYDQGNGFFKKKETH
jgi:hypothetical protein